DLTHVVPGYERLAALAHELAVTPEQAAAVEAADAPVRDCLKAKTTDLLNALSRSSLPGPLPAHPESGGAVRASLLLAAVQDTIRVLEQTKRSFKSRALGQLRERLKAVLRSQGQGD